MSPENLSKKVPQPTPDEATITKYIVTQLGSPTIDKKVLLSNIAYYVPTIKNENNLRAILNGFVNSDFLFASQLTVDNFNDNYTIMELVSTIFSKKITVSCPTISLMRFYNEFLFALISINNSTNGTKARGHMTPIHQNLVIAGIMQVRDVLNEYAVPEEVIFFNKFEKEAMDMFIKNSNFTVSNPSINAQALSFLSVAYCFTSIDQLQKSQYLPLNWICGFSGYLLYESSFGLKAGLINLQRSKTNPVIRLLSRISFLTKVAFVKCANDGDFRTLQIFMDRLIKFSKGLHVSTTDSILKDSEFLNFYKNILFSTVIIFECFTDLSLANNALNNSILTYLFVKNRQQQLLQFSILARKALEVLFYFHFIVTIIGVGGFDAYHKMYMTVIEILMQTNSSKGIILEQLSDYFISQIRFKDLLSDTLNRSKFLFLLGIWETLVSVCSQKYYDSIIKPITFEFINKPYATIDFSHTSTTRAILENCHSVKLQSFRLESLAKYNASSTAVTDYIDILLHQYPLVLSSHQLIFAVTSLASVLNSSGVIGQYNANLQDMFLHKIYNKMLLEPSGKKNEVSKMTSEDNNQGQNNVDPPTTKTTFIYALICCVPYIENEVLVVWLQNIYQMKSKLNVEEANFCEKHLWNVISNDLGLSKADVAIAWWYSKL